MEGRFIRTYWYRRGIEHGNPYFNRGFRVNAPEALLHPQFMYWDEVQGNGMMHILTGLAATRRQRDPPAL